MWTTATRLLVVEGVWVVGQQNADIADTLQLRDVAMATVSWISIYGVHIGTTWRIRLNCPCAAAMQPYVKLPWPLVIITTGRIAALARCGLLLQTVYSVVWRSVGCDRESCKNGWTDRDAVWVMDSGGPKEPCVRRDTVCRYVHVLVLLFLIPQVVKIPEVENKKIKASWNGYVPIPSSTGKVSWKRIVWNGCMYCYYYYYYCYY